MANVSIRVKDIYFKNFMKAVDSLNQFFQSNYKVKNFPMLDDDDNAELVIQNVLTWMDRINPQWIDNPDLIAESLDKIDDIVSNIPEGDIGEDGSVIGYLSSENEPALELINSYIGYKILQQIGDHQSEFEKLLDGIYSMKLFTNPSEYEDAVSLFSKIPEFESDTVRDIIGDSTSSYSVFDWNNYINGIFHNEYIDIPRTLSQEAECERCKTNTDSKNIEIVVDDRTVATESALYVERAEINFFEETNPPHIKYHEDSKKWQISKQFTAAITRLLAGLKTCATVEDIEEFINTNANKINPDDYTCMVLPSILAKVFDNPKKFKNRVFNEDALKKYTDSYASIMKQNDGAKRFKNYDLFSLFKADKEGTLRFLEDFLTLRLVSDPNAYISNHQCLILFNIFDSRIYFDILYNVMPKSVQANEWKNEDNFVKTIRARLNANSRKVNVYDDANKKPVEQEATPEVKTTTEINEYVLSRISDYSDISIHEMHVCEEFVDIVHEEISTIGDKAYNAGVSQYEIDMTILEGYVQEGRGFLHDLAHPGPRSKGELPNYMKQRIQLDDGEDDEDSETEVEDVDVPPDVPTNPIDELADSVDARADLYANGDNDLDDAFGSDANVNPVDPTKPHKSGQIVYNITYNNSFNKTTNDMSENKTIRNNSHDIKNSNIKTQSIPRTNSNNNGTPSANTSDKSNNASENTDTFSTGKSVQEVFKMLYSEEPLFVGEATVKNGPPKQDALTRAMDNDRKTLAMQQEAKKAIQKGANTVDATLRPIDRAKKWLTQVVDSLIKRDEDKVKQELLTDPGYRSLLYRASRLALKIGGVAVATALNPWLGIVAAGTGVAREFDKNRLRKEIQQEYVTEIQILDERIKRLDSESYYGDSKKKKNAMAEKAKLMRLRQQMLNQAARITNSPIAYAKDLN